MLTWIMENMATIIISVVLMIFGAVVIANMVRSKRKGKSICGCGCANCPEGSCCPAGSSCATNGSSHPKSGYTFLRG